MTDLHAISTNAEDYLETIRRLISKKGAARVRDIAAALSLHKSTVSSALKGLAKKGLARYSRYEIVALTVVNENIAQDIRHRHEVFSRFLKEVLGVGDDTAEANACRMEHVVDADVLERISLFVDFANDSLAKSENWLSRFQRYVSKKGKLGVQAA